MASVGSSTQVVDSKIRQTPIHLACLTGNASAIEGMLAYGGSQVDRTLIPLAMQLVSLVTGNLDVLAVLLQYISDVNDCNYLHLASVANHPDVVELLIRRGARTDKRSESSGATPLHVAAKPFRKRQGRNSLQVLLYHRADVHALDHAGQTALHYAASSKRSSRQQVCQLLEAGANIHAETPDGYTPLMFAAASGEYESANLLLCWGATATVAGGDPLLVRVSKLLLGYRSYTKQGLRSTRQKLAYEVLLNAGVALDAPSPEDGNTPLHILARGGPKQVVALLLQRGANLHLLNHRQENPLLCACCCVQGAEVVQYLLDKGSNVFQADKHGSNVLHKAAGAAGACEDTMQLLLTHVGGTHLVDAANRQLQTPLHVACASGNPHVAIMLLSNGATLTAVDCHGKTPLDLAPAECARQLAQRFYEGNWKRSITWSVPEVRSFRTHADKRARVDS